jgi:hypothetical protein
MSEVVAIVTVPFIGAPDGEVYGREFAVGDTVHGDLAAVAIRQGWAEVPGPPKAKKKAEG